MSELDLDFEGTNQQSNNNADGAKSGNQNDNQEDTTALGGNDVEDVTGKDNNKQADEKADEQQDFSSDANHDLTEGTQVEVDGNNYTVNNKGELIDKDGKVFKTADEVKALLDENDVQDDNSSEEDLNIESIQKALGIEITDDNGKPVAFSNDVNGISSYVNEVIEHRLQEVSNGAVNKLFSDNPVLADFYNYYRVHGTAQGFGEMPDRSGWQLDKDNESQLETVIKIAAREFGNKSLNDNYIKYLKSTGSLYDEAKVQLEALQAADKQRKEAYANEVKKREEAQAKYDREYREEIKNVIDTKTLAGYKIPENIVKETNGKKVTYSLNDFYDYVVNPTVVLENGQRVTAFDRDRMNGDQRQLLEQELLEAWLSFTGGSFKDLINMAIKEENVRKLVVKSKENRNKHTIKVVKPKNEKVSPEDILF